MKQMERVEGIEPSYQAWEARVLPLNYTRLEWDGRDTTSGAWGCKGGFRMIEKSRKCRFDESDYCNCTLIGVVCDLGNSISWREVLPA